MNWKAVGLLLCVGPLFLGGSAATAQVAFVGDEAFIELLRTDVREERVRQIRSVMNFTDEEAAAVWPIYEEQEKALNALWDKRHALITDYANHFARMTDEKAEELTGQWFELQAARAKQVKDAFDSYSKVLSPTQTLKLMQLEYRLNLLIDLEIASTLPMVE